MKRDNTSMFDNTVLLENVVITDTLTDLMVFDDEDLPVRLREQEEKLKRRICTNPEIGKLLEEFEMPILLEILNSSDEYYFENFPEKKSFIQSKRQAFGEEVRQHGESCPRCSLKIAFDAQWEGEIEETISSHEEVLKEAFGERREFF